MRYWIKYRILYQIPPGPIESPRARHDLSGRWDNAGTGAGPLVEMFSDRLEITNPGQPLVQPERFLDFPPRSRNEALASLMRRMRLYEEQGTGIDKVFVAVELHQLPPPDFRVEGDAVRAVLYAPRRFAEMTPQERVRACYQHAALSERLGIDPQNAAQASAVIKQALKAVVDPPCRYGPSQGRLCSLLGLAGSFDRVLIPESVWPRSLA